jgi:hypothetical protein
MIVLDVILLILNLTAGDNIARKDSFERNENISQQWFGTHFLMGVLKLICISQSWVLQWIGVTRFCFRQMSEYSYYHHRNWSGSGNYLDVYFSVPTEGASFSNPEGYTSLRVIASPSLNQDQLWRLFDLVPGLDFLHLDTKSRLVCTALTAWHVPCATGLHGSCIWLGIAHPLSCWCCRCSVWTIKLVLLCLCGE